MDKNLRRMLKAMPVRKLRDLQQELDQLVREVANQPPRETDVAFDHTGDPSLVAKVLRIIGYPNSGSWYQVERIYCSPERCPRCPHGDFKFRYRHNKRKGTTSKKYVARMAFEQEVIDRLKAGVRKPAAAYAVEVQDASKPK
jgi:hypothetical protein